MFEKGVVKLCRCAAVVTPQPVLGHSLVLAAARINVEKGEALLANELDSTVHGLHAAVRWVGAVHVEGMIRVGPRHPRDCSSLFGVVGCLHEPWIQMEPRLLCEKREASVSCDPLARRALA